MHSDFSSKKAVPFVIINYVTIKLQPGQVHFFLNCKFTTKIIKKKGKASNNLQGQSTFFLCKASTDGFWSMNIKKTHIHTYMYQKKYIYASCFKKNTCTEILNFHCLNILAKNLDFCVYICYSVKKILRSW